MALVELFVIEGVDGQRVAVGPRQAHWLRDGGFIERAEEESLWRALHGLTMAQVNDLIMSQPELRECDFCRQPSAPWRINCRPFQLSKGPFAGARLGGATGRCSRATCASATCGRTARSNSWTTRSRAPSSLRAGWAAGCARSRRRTPGCSRARTAPAVREMVYGMFANRQGWPIDDRRETPGGNMDPGSEATA